MERFRALAAERFAAEPATRSLMFCVAQYWNDQADDETHSHVVASTRDVPAWPHECDYDTASVEGERCSNCDYEHLSSPYIGVAEWETFCSENADQGQDYGESYLPVAIARRVDTGAAVEWIGRVQRPGQELYEARAVEGGDGARWARDARAAALFAEVCAHPDDDGPRAVLSDYLLEQRGVERAPSWSGTRGEVIALALSRNAEARARHDELLAANGRAWLAPLDAVIPAEGFAYERGFLARADVYAEDVRAVRGAAGWGTVHTLRILSGSLPVLDPAMVALRDVSGVDDGDLATIAMATRPWAIERMHATVAFDTRPILVATTTLPRLRELTAAEVFGGPLDHHLREALDDLRGAAWWPQIERLTVLVDGGGERDPRTLLADWWAIRDQMRVPWLAVCEHRDETGGPAGWEIALGPEGAVEIRMAGWSALGTRKVLADLARAAGRATLVATPHFAPTTDDVAHLRDTEDVEVVIR